jgi:hypothetical protein
VQWVSYADCALGIDPFGFPGYSDRDDFCAYEQANSVLKKRRPTLMKTDTKEQSAF